LAALREGAVDAVVFTSAVQAHHLLAVAREAGCADGLVEALNSTRVVSIGPVCSAALRELGISVTAEARPPKLGPLVDALMS
jgi:uroporphyrinogen-III synthase